MKYNLALIQARMSSSRLQGKVIYSLNGLTVLEYMNQRVKQSELIDKIIFVTSLDKSDDVLAQLFENNGMSYYRGSLNDVLRRFYDCAKEYIELNSLDESMVNIIRLTGDCPLIDYRIIDTVIKEFMMSKVDYCSNTLTATYPDGMDVEVFPFKILEQSNNESSLSSEREHVTLYMKRNNAYKKKNVTNDFNYSHLRLTLDFNADYELLKNITSTFKNDFSYSSSDIVSLLERNSSWLKLNSAIQRDEGLEKSILYETSLERVVDN